MQPLPTGIYGTILQGFFGGLSTDNKSSLWVQFLQSQGLSQNATPAQTVDLESKFVAFLENSATMATGGLSPSEIAKRKLFATVIQDLIELMKQLQNSDVVQNALTLFYTKYQSQYTDMMAAVPLYNGKDSNGVVINKTDLMQTTFGYGNVSLNDLATYMGAGAAQGISGTSFSITTPASNITQPLAIVYTQLDNVNHPVVTSVATSGTISATFLTEYNPQSNPPNSIEVTLNVPSVSSTPLLFARINIPTPIVAAGQTSTEAYIKAWSTAINSAFTNGITPANLSGAPVTGVTFMGRSVTNSLNYNPVTAQFNLSSSVEQVDQFGDPTGTITTSATMSPFNIPWRFLDEEIQYNQPGGFNNTADNPPTDDDATFLSQNEKVQERVQANQKLNAFIENIKSQKDTLQNDVGGVINNIQSSNSSLKSNVGVINSAIHELKTILDGIFS